MLEITDCLLQRSDRALAKIVPERKRAYRQYNCAEKFPHRLSFPSSPGRGLSCRTQIVKQAAGRGNPDRRVRVVEAFLDERQHGKSKLPQCLGGKQPRLRLLILQQCLQYCERLLVGGGAERLCRGGAYRRIRMSRQVCGDENRALVAESQKSLDGAGPHLHGCITSQRLKQGTRVLCADAAETGGCDGSHPGMFVAKGVRQRGDRTRLAEVAQCPRRERSDGRLRIVHPLAEYAEA